MQTYHKIETLFNRDLGGSRRLIWGDYLNKTVEYLKDNRWQFTEKIDGTNIRVHWDGHKVTFGGRTDTSQIPAHLVNKLNELFSTTEAEELFEQAFGEKDVILFGEGYGAKIQDVGSHYRPDVSFVLFDVLIGDNYQTREWVEATAKMFGIDVVPIVLEGTLEDGIRFVMQHPQSTIGTAPMEGVVARPMVEMRDRVGDRIITKIKWKDFKYFTDTQKQ